MRSTTATTATIPAAAFDLLDSGPGPAPVQRLTAHDDGLLGGGLFTEPADVSLLEELQVDELGRRSLWLPRDVLL